MAVMTRRLSVSDGASASLATSRGSGEQRGRGPASMYWEKNEHADRAATPSAQIGGDACQIGSQVRR